MNHYRLYFTILFNIIFSLIQIKTNKMASLIPVFHFILTRYTKTWKSRTDLNLVGGDQTFTLGTLWWALSKHQGAVTPSYHNFMGTPKKHILVDSEISFCEWFYFCHLLWLLLWLDIFIILLRHLYGHFHSFSIFFVTTIWFLTSLVFSD